MACAIGNRNGYDSVTFEKRPDSGRFRNTLFIVLYFFELVYTVHNLFTMFQMKLLNLGSN